MKWLDAGILAVTVSAASGVAAQKVYRCGADGRTYQQTPCAQGQVVDAGDPRTDEQRQAAQAVAKSEAGTAAKFDRELQPASAAKGGKPARAAATDVPAREAAASDAKGKKKPLPDKPAVYLVPANAASAVKR